MLFIALQTFATFEAGVVERGDIARSGLIRQLYLTIQRV